MGDWSVATKADGERLLDSMGPSLSHQYAVERPRLLLCLDQAAQQGPHAVLLILEIARACVILLEQRPPDDGHNDQKI